MTSTTSLDPSVTDHLVDRLTEQHAFSGDAVGAMIDAVGNGFGGMAAFDHPEFGGAGQWMRGGMVLLSGADDHRLRARVDALCEAIAAELAGAPRAASLDPAGPNSIEGRAASAAIGASSRNTNGWPAELGVPTAAGSQNGVRYAYFAAARRLAIDHGAGPAIYDTGAHQISGVAQQQSGAQGSLIFSSPLGPIDVERLPRVDRAAPVAPATSGADHGNDDILHSIERLGALRDRGLITEDEFTAKKSELLARL